MSTIPPYGEYPARLALQHAAQKQAALESVSRAVPADAGRPALRVIDGGLANEPPPIRRPSGERIL
jgi:hypothetical protein